MKIGILGDVHGNIEALKAAYESTVTITVDKTYHLGDLGGYAPFVNEVVDFMIEHGIEGVQGNYDEAVAHEREHCGCKYEDPVQAEMAQQSFEWTKIHTSIKSKAYLGKLPTEIAIMAESKKVMLFHATPNKNNLYWYEDRPKRFFLEMASKTDADILIYGHTHRPYRKDICGKVFINAGSVGKSKDGDPRACITIMEVTPQSVKTEFHRVSYEIEKVASAIMQSGLPVYFAEKLRRGV